MNQNEIDEAMKNCEQALIVLREALINIQHFPAEQRTNLLHDALLSIRLWAWRVYHLKNDHRFN